MFVFQFDFQISNFFNFIFRFSFSFLENGTVVTNKRFVAQILCLFVVFIFFTRNHDKQFKVKFVKI